MPQHLERTILIAGLISLGLVSFINTSNAAQAQEKVSKRPALVITNKPMPASGPNPFYNRPNRTEPITPDQLIGDSYYQPTDTVVSRKVGDLREDLFTLQGTIERLSSTLEGMERKNQALSAEYFANTATISTQLQAGTTPGNPRLVNRLSTAQQNLDELSRNVAELNTLAVQVANSASMASFLLEAARSTYGLSGAIEEDHANLAQLEDQVNNTVVMIDRLLNAVNDNITRTAAYLSSERSNLRTLSLAITNGDLYGRSLANRPFSRVPQSNLMQPASMAGFGDMGAAGALAPMPAPVVGTATPLPQPTASSPVRLSPQPESPRPLAKIKFDRPTVNYEQPVFVAMSEAIERYPAARFELIAIHPTQGNAAQLAIESTRARRNAEKVLRTLTQMGLPADKVDLSYNSDPDAATSEVHIYIR